MAKKDTAIATIDGEIRKANEAIAIRPKSGAPLTFLTRKIYNTLIYYAQQQGVEKRRFRMPLRAITSSVKFDSNDIALIKEHLRKMRRTEIEWNDPGKVWGLGSLLSEAVIQKENGELILEWEYPGTIQKRLLEPMQYTTLALAHQAVMRTHAGLALFEICLRYETFAPGLTERQPWQWWYPVLTGNIDGDLVTSRLYFYRYFKRDTVKPAIAEVNSLTDFQVELIEHTQGRKVIDLQFRIAKRKQQQLNLDTQIFDVSLISRMTALGLSDQQAQKLYSENEENRIRVALELVEKKMRSRAKLESPVAYFRSALSGDWLKTELPPAPKTPTLPSQVDDRTIPDPEQAARRQAALDRFDAMDDNSRALLLAQFNETYPLLAARTRKNPRSKAIRSALAGWLLTLRSDS